MNSIPTTDHRPPPQPHRPSFSCDLHPDEKFNGFCPSCLCDRLSATSSLFRRTQSFSASKHGNSSGSAFEPQRRSCDVRGPIEARTLARNVGGEIRAFDEPIRSRVERIGPIENQSRARADVGRAQTLTPNVGGEIRASVERIGPIEEQSRVRVLAGAVRAQTLTDNVGDEIMAFEADRAPTLAGNMDDEIRAPEDPISSIEGQASRVQIRDGKAQTLGHNVGDEIRPSRDSIPSIKVESRGRVPSEAGRSQSLSKNVGSESRTFDEEIAIEEEMKMMRDYIDLDFQAKKKKPSAGFWSATSVFSKKWNKWMKKQKGKKESFGVERTVLPVEKPARHKHRETQSEVADYGFGRRSCDTDPRFSIDIGRVSIDGPRPSFDPPRASWDGHMTRRSNFSDHRVPVVEPIPGDSVQTHQYYLDTSSRRRKSFDRSGSKKGTLVVGSEVDEMMVGLNAKVTPETFDFHQRKSISNSWRDECSEIFELGIRDDGSVIGNVEEKGTKKSGRWGKKWNFWGLINGRNSKYDEDDRYSRRNGFDRSSSVRGNNGDIKGGTSGNMYRRTSSVSLSNANIIGGLGGHVRNPSIDNGLLRFYLTSPRSNNHISGSRKISKTDKSHSINRGVYRY